MNAPERDFISLLKDMVGVTPPVLRFTESSFEARRDALMLPILMHPSFGASVVRCRRLHSSPSPSTPDREHNAHLMIATI